MEKYIEIFNQLWEHTESEEVEFKKAETRYVSTHNRQSHF